MRFRVVSWNVDSRPTGSFHAKLRLLNLLEPDLALLQELRRPVYKSLLPHAQFHLHTYGRLRHFSWGVLSTDLADPPAPDRRVGCAVLGGARTALLGAGRLEPDWFSVDAQSRAAFLNRTVVVGVALAGGPSLIAGSFQAPRLPGGEGAAGAGAFHAGLARWAHDQLGTTVIGIDAGAPTVDHPDARWSQFVAPGAGELLGSHAGHRLRDVLRCHLDRHPEKLEAICEERPEGPLAVSRLVEGRPVRHDHVWATPDLEVLDARYCYEEAVETGSDHAVVVVDLEANDGQETGAD